MGLTRSNSTIRHEAGNGSTVLPAIVWGSTQQASFSNILRAWFAKERYTPIEIMLAKLLKESQRMVKIARYEIGQHQGNFKWANMSEFEATSFGLFQALGGWLVKYGLAPDDWNDVFASFTLGRQLDLFDAMMKEALQRAGANTPRQATDAQARQAIIYYAGFYVASIIEPNVQAYAKIKARDRAWLNAQGMSNKEIDMLNQTPGQKQKLVKLGFVVFVVVCIVAVVWYVRKKPDLTKPLKLKK